MVATFLVRLSWAVKDPSTNREKTATTGDDTKHEYFGLEHMVGKNWG